MMPFYTSAVSVDTSVIITDFVLVLKLVNVK